MEENTSKVYRGASGLDGEIAAGTGAGSPLFVINLCASIAPIDPAGKNLPGLENYRLYQVARVEDGRTRHRLRLGFFTSESHAQSVLAVVRQQYPTAFTTCLCNEDRRFARGYLPDTADAPRRPVAVVSNAAPAAQPKQVAPAPAPAMRAPTAAKSAAPAPKTVAKPAAAPPPVAASAAKPAASKTLTRAEPEVVEISWQPDPPPAKAAPSTSDTAKHPVLKPAAKAQPVVNTAAVSKSPAARAPAATQPAKVDTAASMRVPALQLTLSEPPPPAAQKPAKPAAEPFHVGRGVDIADVGISLESESPAKKAASKPAVQPPAPVPKAGHSMPNSRTRTPVQAKPAKPAAPRVSPPAQKPMQPAVAKSAAPPAPAKPALMPYMSASSSLPELDSTQTIRALTSAELQDEQQEKWFAVQLAASEQPVNLDTMPRLDIFEAYRLYSVATAGSGKIVHSLRLGFFKEAVSAEAVSGYLKTFFSTPTIIRVSLAEHARFKEPPARKSAPKREAQIVELNNARAARPVIPTVTMEVAPPKVDTSATGSFKVGATGSPAQKTAAKSAAPATKRSSSNRTRTDATGKYKALRPKKSLSEELLEEARQVELSESAIRRLPKNHSLLSRLVGKLTK